MSLRLAEIATSISGTANQKVTLAGKVFCSVMIDLVRLSLELLKNEELVFVEKTFRSSSLRKLWVGRGNCCESGHVGAVARIRKKRNV